MKRHGMFFTVALALLGITGGLLIMPRDVTDIPLVAPFAGFPITLKGWTGSTHVPPEVLPIDPRVPDHLLRTYQNGTMTVWVSVGYYPNQAEGRRPPAQELLFPGRGWSTLTTRTVRIPLDERLSRSIPANLLVMRTGDRQTAILYWYQVQTASIASDHWYRALLLYKRLVHRRAEGALVRIASPMLGEMDPASVLVVQTEFIQAFYPELLAMLPR